MDMRSVGIGICETSCHVGHAGAQPCFCHASAMHMASTAAPHVQGPEPLPGVDVATQTDIVAVHRSNDAIDPASEHRYRHSPARGGGARSGACANEVATGVPTQVRELLSSRR